MTYLTSFIMNFYQGCARDLLSRDRDETEMFKIFS